MNDSKRKKIPKISPDRLDHSPVHKDVILTKDEKKAQLFLKGKETIKQFPLRMPLSLYKELRQVAFDEDVKINNILIELIKSYVKKQTSRQ